MHALKLIFKNSLRHKLRTTLTILGITVAILSFGLLRTVVSAWYAGVEASSASRLITRHAVSLTFFLPLSYKDKIRQIPGVKQVSHAYWFAGTYISEKNFIPNFACDARTFLDLYPEFMLTDAEKKAFMIDRKGCIVGKKLARRFNWKAGDSVTLKGTVFPGNWDFVIRGIYKGKERSTDENQFFFHYDYLNEALKKTAPRRADMAGWYAVGVTRPEIASEVAAAIDNTFKNSLAETMTETEKAFQMSFVSMTEAIVVAIQLVSFVVIFIIMAVMANTMAMTARERIGEYAIMKTLGYGGFHITGLILGESLLISAMGCALGIVLTYPAAQAFGRTLEAFFPVFNVARSTIYLDIAAAVIVGVIAAMFPAWQAVKLRIADGLRRIG